MYSIVRINYRFSSNCYFLLLLIIFLSKNSAGQSLQNQEEILLKIKNASTEMVQKAAPLKYSKEELLEIKVPAEKNAVCNFASIKRYIPLETTKDFLIGKVSAIEFLDDKLYILDKSTNSVYIFNINGKFLKKIHDRGNGPKEYIKLGSMYVSKESIILFDVQKKRFSYYDLNGNFIGVKSALFWNQSFSMFPTGEFCYYLAKAYNSSELLITDAKLVPNKKGVAPTSAKSMNYYHTENYFKDYAAYKLFMPAFRDTLYQFNQDSLYAKYALNYGSRRLPDDYWKGGIDGFLNRFQDENHVFSLGDFFESDRFVGFNIGNSRRSTELIYCKSTRNVFYGYLKDKETQLPLFYTGKSSKSSFILDRDPEYLLQFYKENKEKEFPKEFVQLCKTIKKYDNPVIVMFDLENF